MNTIVRLIIKACDLFVRFDNANERFWYELVSGERWDPEGW